MMTLSVALREALEIARKDQNGGGARWISPSAARLREIRAMTGLSQNEFCQLYGFDLESYRRWEQDRGKPEAISRLLIQLIEQDPPGMAKRINAVRSSQAHEPEPNAACLEAC
jgi:DNA-binding transcriptional regulator YiaG